MKKIIFTSFVAFSIFMTSCNEQGQKSGTESSAFSDSNPFAEESRLQYQAPDFSRIKNSDFAPAFEEGMKRHLVEIEQIANSTETPTFENTIVAMERSGQLLNRARSVFGLLTSAHTNDELKKLDEMYAPNFSAHSDAIYLNDALFRKVKDLYDKRNESGLDAESLHLLEYYYQRFEMAGAQLNAADKEQLKKLNEEEAGLTTKFNNQLLDATKKASVVFTDKAQLEGLSDSEIEAAADAAKSSSQPGKWMLSLQNTTQQPELTSLKNRAVRKQLFEASWNRAEQNDNNDTRAILERLAQLRSEKARLLGFPSYAAWKLQDQMAKTPEAVQAFLDQLVPAAVAKAKDEAAALQEIIDKENDTFRLTAYDWNYYSEKLRKAKYDLDESQIKPYFVLDSVLINGVFYAATELYGITFKQRKDLPAWHEDVHVYEVFDKDGSSMALFYTDYFKRENKIGGAWMGNLVDQSTLMGTKPVIYNVCNYTKPAAGQPALISFDDVTTLFHEFGHALHGLFAAQKYQSLSGTATPRDFVEFPSQFNEHWALDPKVLKNYARHYQTGETIPQALIDKIKSAGAFNQGYAFTEYLAAATLDQKWHTLAPGTPMQQTDSFEQQALTSSNLWLEQVPPRYRSSYFLHIWSNGYSAAYYAYSWAETLGHDAYAWFEENGGLTRENGQVFRDKILSRGNTEAFESLYRNFRGKDPSIMHLLKYRGIQ